MNGKHIGGFCAAALAALAVSAQIELVAPANGASVHASPRACAAPTSSARAFTAAGFSSLA